MLSEVNLMSHSSRLEVLQIKRDQLKARLVEIGEMRPGSLVERFRKCGKPTCHCAEKNAPGHGPCYSLTHAVAGKTETDRKSTRLNSSHLGISYAVFCLKKKITL